MDTDKLNAALESLEQEMDAAREVAEIQRESLSQIEYTKTRTIDVSPEILRRSRITTGQDPGPYVDAYKVLRTRVLQKMRERGWNTIAVTSPNPRAGTTCGAINLAINLALEVNQTVLLVDTDLRKPTIHKSFGFNPEFGLTDYLLDHVPVEKMLIHPKGIGRFVILPGSRPLINSAEMLSSPRMAKLVHELKARYPSRIIVFDLPHLQTADALAFAPLVDVVLLVIEAGKTTQSELTHAIESLYGKPIIGSLLNKAEQTSAAD